MRWGAPPVHGGLSRNSICTVVDVVVDANVSSLACDLPNGQMVIVSLPVHVQVDVHVHVHWGVPSRTRTCDPMIMSLL